MSTEENRNINPEVEEELSEEKLNEQRLIRREKLKKLQEMGRNPFLVENWDVKTTLKKQKVKKYLVQAESWLTDTWEKLLLSIFRISRAGFRVMSDRMRLRLKNMRFS